jgi:hypothetical protein
MQQLQLELPDLSYEYQLYLEKQRLQSKEQETPNIIIIDIY